MLSDVASVAAMLTVLDRVPGARDVAERALALEQQACDIVDCRDYSALHLETRRHGGFTWDEVHAPGTLLAQLAVSGLLGITRRSRSGPTQYCLVDRAAVQAALASAPLAAVPLPQFATEPALPADIWADVVGLDFEKAQLRACLEAERPVSALLDGPPASAKSVLTAEIALLPGTVELHGGGITAAGLAELLLGPNPPRRIVVDEADKGRPMVLNRLLGVLETGTFTDLAYGRHRVAQLTLWAFFVVNDPSRLDPALRSRLWPIHLRAYDEPTVRAVIAGFLVRREGVEPELAQEIATLVVPFTSDVRRARDIARLCRGDRRRAAEFAAVLREQQP